MRAGGRRPKTKQFKRERRDVRPHALSVHRGEWVFGRQTPTNHRHESESISTATCLANTRSVLGCISLLLSSAVHYSDLIPMHAQKLSPILRTINFADVEIYEVGGEDKSAVGWLVAVASCDRLGLVSVPSLSVRVGRCRTRSCLSDTKSSPIHSGQHACESRTPDWWAVGHACAHIRSYCARVISIGFDA